MKYAFLISMFFINAAYSQVKIDNKPKDQKQYLVKELKDVWIGMPKEKLLKLKPSIKPKTKVLDYPVEIINSKSVNNITYQITHGILYECIVEYKPGYNLEKMAVKKYGPKNNSNQGLPGWEFHLAGGLDLLIWTFQNKLCIADASQF